MLSALSLFRAEDGEFSPPSIFEFYPEIVAFADTPFAINRIMMIRLIVMVLLIVIFWLWTAKFNKAVKTGNVVPGRFQLLGELALNFVRKSIAHDQLGEKDGERFLPLLTTIFFMVFGMNITGMIPFANIAGTSVIGIPTRPSRSCLRDIYLRRNQEARYQVLQKLTVPFGSSKAFLHFGYSRLNCCPLSSCDQSPWRFDY